MYEKFGAHFEDFPALTPRVLTWCIVTMGQVTSQPALRIVRTIPNTPVKVRRGSVAVTFSEGCSGQDKEVVNTIFSRWVHTAV